MLDLPSFRPEMRYGMPAADQILINRYYIVGYSHYFRQAKWALEIVDVADTTVPREDHFRSDYRIPPMFRADLQDFRGSEHDRGHLVASANQRETRIQNSETFLLSNMSPQKPGFNRQVWGELEQAVRDLHDDQEILQVYVVTGPIFDFTKAMEIVGGQDDNNVTLPIPHAYYKSVLAENDKGKFSLWSFILPNEASDAPLHSFAVKTTEVEQKAGILLWDRLTGPEVERKKKRISRMPGTS
ncbi:MAG: DNA/RNA non-specific endonuclease [Alphaproteobacteria bacterium]|jgi:endonuclease G, mitochondrial|nr:DNA/RNA endonuclease G [Rhodospirillaceae bacterium]MDG2482649.1 DNA/RNA non-specific endonuclease [Alphaproteobacteria bacterium]MBT6204336.1 DNA/RNA endonuclease G [Rhodospirillaceae bacterium]MBT6510951.1 DNA/RNA endonuclease G [Rhodospirillaceae bacterium]MBT7612019.1 DNA/RNA endonuclease G [Rhodospirillaceae bacterium]